VEIHRIRSGRRRWTISLTLLPSRAIGDVSGPESPRARRSKGGLSQYHSCHLRLRLHRNPLHFHFHFLFVIFNDGREAMRIRVSKSHDGDGDRFFVVRILFRARRGAAGVPERSVTSSIDDEKAAIVSLIGPRAGNRVLPVVEAELLGPRWRPRQGRLVQVGRAQTRTR
jgi:hypothetical protein